MKQKLPPKKILFLTLTVIFVAVACNTKPKLTQDAIIELRGHKYSVQFADTPLERDRGLSGIPSISDTEGMLFLFSEPQKPKFWMKDVLFPIDIIWINGNTIVDITENVPAEPNKSDHELPTYSPRSDADKVLEVNSGWVLRRDIKVGDTIILPR